MPLGSDRKAQEPLRPEDPGRRPRSCFGTRVDEAAVLLVGVQQRLDLILKVTLTIRRTESSASFVLHRRDPAKVAVAGGMLHIMPAGVFQPAGISSQAQRHDFDLCRNVMREYSEEFLGDPEHDGSSGSLVDYDHEEPFRSLDQARRDGRVRAWLLGMGLDALVLAGEILSVVVFDADIYDEIFGDAVAVNTEGNVVSSGMAGATGIGFNEENIRHIVDHEPIAPSAAACLELAWQHRDRILAR